jgi:PAS domain S-box-containing protein
MIGFGLRDTVSDLFSVYISNVLYFIFTFLHIISVVSYKGSLNKRFAYAIGSILLLCIPLFLVFRDNEQYRVIFSSYGIASAYVTGAIFLFANRKPYKLPILLAAGFLLFGVINIFRGTNIFFIIGEYRFTDLTSWDMIFVLTGIVTILVSSFGFLLLLKEVDDSIIFRQNKLSETAFDQSPVSVVITDDEGNIQYVNPNFSQLTGYTPDEVKGKKANVLRTPMTPNETFQDLWKTVKSGEIWRGEFVNKKKNNEIYYEEAVIAPIKDERLNIVNFLAIKTDITQRKMDEALIQKRNMELSELNSTKDRMFSIIAHDLKGPIGNLQQLLEIIDHDINKGNTANVYELLDILKGTSRTAFELLDNLLAWARSQLNAISINPETC